MDKYQVYRQVGALHARNLDQGFLASLGEDFLALMYQAVDEAPDSVLLVEQHAGKVVGFVSGGLGMSAIYRRMLGHPLPLALALAPCVWHPGRLWRVLEILRYGRSSAQRGDFPDAELFSIAVSPQWRGQQVAERLYLRLVEHFSQCGIQAFKITVGEALVPAHRFYRRMGAVAVADVQVHGGECSLVYLHRLVPAGNGVPNR